MSDEQDLRSLVRDDMYRVQRVLSEGPGGRTELVTLDGEGPLVRKRIPSELANAAAWAVAMELDEPLLPRIESFYRMPGEFVVVYEYVDGVSLSELVEVRGALGAEWAVRIVSDVCHAVSALHERNVIHRDITPGNVIVAADGAHLVDLGIARQHTDNQRRDTTHLGTWGYAAPEQFGFAQTDVRSDVYALGSLLGYALTGLTPATDEYFARLDDVRWVDARLAQVVHKATAFEPSARYQSAHDLRDHAQAVLRGEPIPEPIAARSVPAEPASAVSASSSASAEPSGSAWPAASARRSGPVASATSAGFSGSVGPSTSTRPAESVGPATSAGFSASARPSASAEFSGSVGPTASTRPATSAGPATSTGFSASARPAASTEFSFHDSAADQQARPLRFGERYVKLSLAERLGLWTVFLPGTCWNLLVLYTVYCSFFDETMEWGAAQNGIGFASIVAVLYGMRETWLAVSRQGAYATTPKRLRHYVARSVLIFLLTMASFAIIIILVYIFDPQQGG